MLDVDNKTRVEMDWSGPERLQMNMGPQHPSAHGVFRAILGLQGETVVDVDAVIGYLHRCHEKLSETLTYAQYPSIASKTDYVAAMTSEFAYVLAAEEIGKFEVPKRAQYLRVIDAELQRIAGPLLRGSGVNFDLRKNVPYSSYGDFDFTVPVETAGDCYARYKVRMAEFRQASTIVRQALDALPSGPISSRPALKSVAQIRIPKGEAYARVEGPRGEVGSYIVSDGSAKPYRMKWRGASFSNLAILPHIIPGHKVADVVAIMGSVDPVFGEVDR